MLVGAGIGVTPCASIMKGVVGYRWKKGYTPNNLHFFWVARLTDLTTFKWLLVMLPELKAQELVHNEYYGGDEGQRQGLEKRAGDLNKRINKGGAASNALPPGWVESTQGGQTYYTNSSTGETQWERPVAPPASAQMLEAELQSVQGQLKAVGAESRTLTITLYLTGCKPEQLKPEATPSRARRPSSSTRCRRPRTPTRASPTCVSRRAAPTGTASTRSSPASTAVRTSASSSAALR